MLRLSAPNAYYLRTAQAQTGSVRRQLQAALVTLRAGAELVRTTPVLLLLFTAQLFVGAFLEGFFRIQRAHLLTNVSRPRLVLPGVGALDVIVWFGVLDGLNSLLTLIGAEIVRRSVDLTRPVMVARLLVGCYTLVLVGGLCFALTGAFAVAAGALLIVQLFQQLAQPVTAAWLNQHIASDVRATVLSLSSQVSAAGQLGGGLGVGVVSNRYGMRAGLMLATLFVTPLLALYAGSAVSSQRAVASRVSISEP